ncbi:calcium/sodium antiporter [Modicisalibacter luteus]|uniref:Calcium/sodium antiporter n=1 Tax=Modicisalibacter luteus TaxID=453962 RepID=A0ABV7M3F7_9GAMM|nr:calcium/sodium antiporter [Halomonas lutea]GHA84742.1 sodium:calcium antiporter [Halomonas lutea]
MWLPLVAIIVGLVLLAWSADRFIDGAAATAFHLGMPPLLVGLLIIGFGTSAPEMVVSALAAIQGSPGLALGNAYGSNIANIGLILGVVALLSPLAVPRQLLRLELPFLGAVTLLSGALLIDGTISRIDAALLLFLLLSVIILSILRARQRAVNQATTPDENQVAVQKLSLRQGLFWTVAGLVVLIASSRLLVWGAVSVAEAMGVSDLIIGLTVVAIGTSLPELASSISAVRKQEHDIVLGNVVGSNLYNTLAVVGLAGIISPIDSVSEALYRDWPVMAVLTLAMALFCLGRGGPGRVSRPEATLLLVAYLGYNAYLIGSAVIGQTV